MEVEKVVWVHTMVVYDHRHSRYIAFNRRVAAEPRVISTIYPAGDGMVLAVKIS